jgi:hypothetical protein
MLPLIATYIIIWVLAALIKRYLVKNAGFFVASLIALVFGVLSFFVFIVVVVITGIVFGATEFDVFESLATAAPILPATSLLIAYWTIKADKRGAKTDTHQPG